MSSFFGEVEKRVTGFGGEEAVSKGERLMGLASFEMA